MPHPGRHLMHRGARAARPLGLLALVVMAGCATPKATPGSPASPAAAEAVGPTAAPVRTITDLPSLRRCMDNLLVDYGVRELTVAVEGVADRSSRPEAGGGDTLVAAVSELTPRSRAIRVVSAGGSGAQAKYTLRAAIGPVEGAPQAGVSGFGLDLTVLASQEMSVVPGTASRTGVTLRETAAGGQAEMLKFGSRLSLATTAGQGRAQALRAVADVASIEAFGRLARVPYWTCFGAGGADPAVAAEIQDGYDTMAGRPAELIGWFQTQLAVRRLYDGPVDGSVNPQFKEAVARYREVLGLSREPKISLDFYQAYLGADHRALAARVAATPVAAVASPVAGAAPELALRIAASSEAQRFARGEAVQLTVKPSRDANVYCFHQDENRRITRFFPNRFQPDSRVPAGTPLRLPGAMRFEIVMNSRAVTETIACFATEGDVLARLPAASGGADFSPLRLESFDQLRRAFVAAAGGPVAQDSFQMRAK